MNKFYIVAVISLCVAVAFAQIENESNPEKDPLAEECRRNLNTCLDKTESRVPGAFDMDHCCDEYKKCMHRIGRNRQ
ncbi:hypothetical protein JTE90_009113 [Oedothorax gibbosus]|uniref:Uncharacterized protein n=1 Tax=Oedothorax gibbosus TaxID=931172 RepID=A0AAV6UFD8_9ARAC|nr:hypothetical protein JTE90_009113 [Oedothorax gibbosus]